MNRGKLLSLVLDKPLVPSKPPGPRSASTQKATCKEGNQRAQNQALVIAGMLYVCNVINNGSKEGGKAHVLLQIADQLIRDTFDICM